jgi:hypothetical protein
VAAARLTRAPLAAPSALRDSRLSALTPQAVINDKENI